MKRVLLLVTLMLMAAPLTPGQQMSKVDTDEKKVAMATTASDMGFYAPGAIKWNDGPPSLPAGSKVAVLEGDPSKEGFFTMRLWLPDGFKIAPHWHPKVEHVTVISGTFYLGMGEEFDQAAGREMSAGSFGYWPAGMRHFAWVKGDTILQLHGIGPWMITYVNPADDPRNAKQ